MANRFNFENTLSELSKMDAPIQKGPVMRWQRKAQEAGVRLAVHTDQASSLSPWKPKSGGAMVKTPGRTPRTPMSAKSFTPNTPGKTPGKSNALQVSKQFSSKTPNKKLSKTPVAGQGADDRFIPNRSSMDFGMSHYAMVHKENENSQENVEYQQQLSEVMGNPQDAKILSFKQRPIPSKEGHSSNLRVLYSASKCNAPKAQNTRHIPQIPERILDAPELLDDYYLNLIDWSSNGHVAVALGDAAFLWNAGDGSITQLCEMGNPDEYISSVAWVNEGNILALASSNGLVGLWDASQQKLVRSMSGHAARVGSLSWNSYILSSGARSGVIHHHDVRVEDHQVGVLTGHTQEICGLKWSPDGRYLASGGNDNLVNIWDASLGSDNTPLHTLTQHQAAVKALAWCPWQPQILASGGGTADRHIRFWNVATGTSLNSIDTNSQVCSILWSNEYKELITGHGYSRNQLIVWKYPSMKKVTELTGHTARILSLTMSADGTKVMSAAADETLRLWKCFGVDKSKKTKTSKSTKSSSSLTMMHQGIR